MWSGSQKNTTESKQRLWLFWPKMFLTHAAAIELAFGIELLILDEK